MGPNCEWGHSIAPIDGILGLDTLSQSEITIDYRAKLISFRLQDERSLGEADFNPEVSLFIVELTVQNKPLRVVLDTGADSLVLFESRLSAKVDLTGNQAAKRALLREVRLGRLRFEALAAVLLDKDPVWPGVDGFVGPRALGLNRVQINFQKQTLAGE